MNYGDTVAKVVISIPSFPEIMCFQRKSKEEEETVDTEDYNQYRTSLSSKK